MKKNQSATGQIAVMQRIARIILKAWKRTHHCAINLKGGISPRKEKSMEGNQMKMREALVKAKKAICHHAKHVCQSLSWENSNIQSNCADVLCAHRDLCEAKTAINAALSAPARQCDVGTAEEQTERFREFCQADKCGRYRCRGWSKSICIDRCAIDWAQTPYEAEEGGAE